MKKRYIRFRLGALAAAVCALATVVLAEPGASDDPLISKSYIENQLMPQIKQYIESRLAEVGGGGSGGGAAARYRPGKQDRPDGLPVRARDARYAA